VPNPGSDKAMEKGCECPTMDNHRGKGIIYKGEVAFWITTGCPMHAPVKDTSPL
jgi:hypothetical protein